MDNLINIIEKQGQQLVSARELYTFLEIETRFNDWMPRMIEYGFEEGVDYEKSSVFVRGQRAVEYAIKMDMAKEIAMIQRSAKGKQARKYFIETERLLKNDRPNSLMEWIEFSKAKALKAEQLQVALDQHLEWSSVKNVLGKGLLPYLTEKNAWPPLKRYSRANDLPIIKVPDVNYGQVNTYHADAWKAIYDIDILLVNGHTPPAQIQ